MLRNLQSANGQAHVALQGLTLTKPTSSARIVRPRQPSMAHLACNLPCAQLTQLPEPRLRAPILGRSSWSGRARRLGRRASTVAWLAAGLRFQHPLRRPIAAERRPFYGACGSVTAPLTPPCEVFQNRSRRTRRDPHSATTVCSGRHGRLGLLRPRFADLRFEDGQKYEILFDQILGSGAQAVCAAVSDDSPSCVLLLPGHSVWNPVSFSASVGSSPDLPQLRYRGRTEQGDPVAIKASATEEAKPTPALTAVG